MAESVGAEPAGAEDIYLTVDQLLEDARKGLEAVPDVNGVEVDTLATGTFPVPNDATIRHLRSVIEKGRRTGCILDSFEERRIAQKELDYLAKVLENFGLSFQETTLEPFSAARLHAIAVPADPFDVLPPRADSITAPTEDALQAYVWQHLDAVGLRSDRELWDHLIAPLAGDPEAWPLLDFTLKRLYENLKREGTGNKLQWPKGMLTNCRALLAETAREVLEGMPKADQDDARKVLVALGMDARRRHGRLTNSASDGIVLPDNAGTRRALAILEQQGLVRCVHPGIGERRWRLVHRSLNERWGELQRWVDAEQMQQRRRSTFVFWLSFAIAITTVLSVATLLFHKRQMDQADALAGAANVRLFELGGVIDEEGLRNVQNQLLGDVQEAYATGETSIAYAALFNAVNRIAHARESMSAQITNSYLVTFARKPGEPTIKLSIPAQEDFVPGKIAGQVVATAFSPGFESVAIAYMTDEATPELRLNVYRWGVPEPVYADHPCPQDTGQGNVRLSAAGRFFAIECTSANQIIGAANAADKVWIDRMFHIVGMDKLAQERFPFFSGERAGELHMITVSVSGDLKVRALDGQNDRDITFRIPLFATIIPMDTTYDHLGKRVAVLDNQGVVAIHGQANALVRLFSPLDEAPALLFINANSDAQSSSNLVWQPVNVEFLPGGKCLRVRRMAIDRNIVAGSFLQHFWDELFVTDATTLLDMARRLSANEKIWQMPCGSNGTDRP